MIDLNDKSKTHTSFSGISRTGGYLTFNACGGVYGVDILLVREIRGYTEPTRIAQADEFMLGVINLRGAIVPILDMRKVLGAKAPSFDSQTVVIVVSVDGAVFGVVVDAVNDVVTIPEVDLKPPPGIVGEGGQNHVGAIASVNDNLLQLLDIRTLFEGVSIAAFHQG